MINVLWGEFWPRYTALWWAAGSPADGSPGYSLFGFGPIPAARLEQAMQRLIEEEAAALGLTAPGGPPGWGETRFQRRMLLLWNHFSGADPLPVSFVGEGEYDFVLSDVGLELFAPKQPKEDFEYVRYYAFRHTGRPSLGVPLYLKEADLALALDAPTGPSQILSSENALAQLHANASGCRLSQLACFCRPTAGDRLKETYFTFQGFLAATESMRHWQLEGAVYRGILTELPRVIAEIWLERYHGATSSSTYNALFRTSTTVENGIRRIFKERLETSLPAPPRMSWEVGPAGTLALDVTLSQGGIVFPPLPTAPLNPDPNDWHVTPDRPRPRLILREIYSGRAGNPVFTDSKRPDGDE
ncbi:MAG TPA: hypothetical protein VLH75_00625 [Longimicrobiales bacterium]|nr:hypothetical protein [Longimicrobiales bacterium]